MSLSPQKQAEFYNRQARSYNLKYESTYVYKVTKIELENGLDKLSSPNLGDVLEIGCGSAKSLKLLSGKLSSYTGVDISLAQIEEARACCNSYGNEVRFKVGDVKNLSFPANRFDSVLSMGCIHHIDDPSSVLQEIYRVLKPGGYVLLYEPSNHNIFIRFLRFLFKKIHPDFHSDEVAFYREEVVTLLKETGFEDVSFMFQIYFLGFYSVFNIKTNYLLDLLFELSRKIDQHILKSNSVPFFIKKQAFSFFATAKKR